MQDLWDSHIIALKQSLKRKTVVNRMWEYQSFSSFTKKIWDSREPCFSTTLVISVSINNVNNREASLRIHGKEIRLLLRIWSPCARGVEGKSCGGRWTFFQAFGVTELMTTPELCVAEINSLQNVFVLECLCPSERFGELH